MTLKQRTLAVVGAIVLTIGGYFHYTEKKELPQITQLKGKTICMKGEVFYDQEGKQITPDITYEVVKEQVIDQIDITKLNQSIYLEGKFDAEIVATVMDLAYNKAMQRTGFQYNNPPNFYSCFIYHDKEVAELQLDWLARFIKYHDQNVPTKDLNLDLIKNCQIPASVRFSYEEPVRKEIFNALANPSQLTKKQTDSIFNKYKLTQPIADSIRFEGAIKGWAWRYWYKKRD
jgi:hypothetical protein